VREVTPEQVIEALGMSPGRAGMMRADLVNAAPSNPV